MMGFLKLVLAFAPWLSFLIIAHGSMFRLELGLGIALALSILMGVLKLHRGVILWVGLAFFSAASILVIGFQNMWTVRYMGVLANGAWRLAHGQGSSCASLLPSITPGITPIRRSGIPLFFCAQT